MKKFWIFFLLIWCVGCMTVKIPKYLKDEFPYKHKFYASFDDTLDATIQALNDSGWKVADTSHPAVFEQGIARSDVENKQILLFTDVRQTPLLLSSRYMSLNVYIFSSDETTDVEVRYMAVTPVLFRSAETYKNDPVVNKVFDRIETILEK